MRLSVRASGLLAAAALAGAIVYWRAGERRRSGQLADDVDEGIAQGREQAAVLREGVDEDSPQFDQR